jgi:L-alanine-DL-glutamate epimerase-like enolase superfamily enzyme
MKLTHAKLFPLDIPFVEQFAHATKTRRASDSVLLRLTFADGSRGWGETLVRPYLTGETVAVLAATIGPVLSHLSGVDLTLQPTASTPEGKLASISDAIDSALAKFPRPVEIKSWNGMRCLVELAIIDALLRKNGQGLGELLPPARKEVTYSGVISAEDPDKSIKIVRQLKQLGIQNFKLKVTPTTGVDLVRSIRALIDQASLCLDANASFSLPDAVAFCKSIEPYNVAAIEEPLAEATPEALGALQQSTSIPIMCDESLVSFDDARELVRRKSAKMFNVRLAKCGGISSCLKLVAIAREAGIGIQLGALVGETAILSSAGRSLAASCPDFTFIEGSYGTLLLKEDIARQSVRFGHGGRAPLLRGEGLNVIVDEEVVMKYTRPELIRDIPL